MSLPTGTVTFLFTDIEGSTKLWEHYPDAMSMALARHDRLLTESIAANGGVVFKTVGDAFCAAFATAPDALMAALTSQRAIIAEPWPQDVTIRVRMALHTGTVEERDGEYFGQPLNRVSRLLGTGHGGQTLLSLACQDLVRDALPAGATLQDWGERRLKDLGRPEHVYQLLHPDLLAEFPPLRSLDNPDMPNNLPQQVTTFIGREREDAEVKTLLAQTHLLTLTGVGGTGKTRLSIQVAADLLDQFFDGVWLIELASVTDPSRVGQSIAQTLGISEEPGQRVEQTLARALKEKRLLLLLDNCEHVLGACAGLADTLIRSCPQVKIIATSREALGIAGEQVYRLPSLSLPDPKVMQTSETLSQFEAVRLFIDRAQLVQPHFTVTNDNAPAVAAICHRIDGIPLAIELAAARVRAMTVEQLMVRLDDRFRLLTGGSRTALPRQQTLRALIDWSYDLLTEPEKVLWQRLSVFSGGWTLEAAETVCLGDDIEDWEVLDLMTSLVDKSLVLYTEAASGTGRYRLLEMVRQYGRDRLAESDSGSTVRDRHAEYYLALAKESDAQMNGPGQGAALTQLETEHDNLRAALAWSSETGDAAGATRALRLGYHLWQFWRARGHFIEGRQHLAVALTNPAAQARTEARADALNSAGILASDQGDYAAAKASHEESLAIWHELNHRSGIASSLNSLGSVALKQGELDTAKPMIEEALHVYRDTGFQPGIRSCLNSLGCIAGIQDDSETAMRFFQECLDLDRVSGHQQAAAGSAFNLAHMVKHAGDHARAHSLYAESLTIFWEQGNLLGVAYGLAIFAIWQAEQPDIAARLWAASYGIRETLQVPLPPREQAENDVYIACVRAAMGDTAFETAWAEGQAMPLAEAVTLALEAPADV